MANFKAAPESSAERYARQKFMENNPELRDIPMINLTGDLRKAGMIRSFPKVGPHKEERFHEMISPMYDAAYELGMDWREGKREQKKRAIEIQQEMEAHQKQLREDFEREVWRRYFELKEQGLNPKTPSFPWDEEPTPEFPSDKDLVNYGSNEQNPESIDTTPRANGGRIGYALGGDLRSRYEEAVRDNGYEGSYDDFIQDLWEMENEMKSSSLRNGGRIGYALGGNEMLRDSRSGLGSMMAADDSEMRVPTDMIDDPGGMFETDPMELREELDREGMLRTAAMDDPMLDIVIQAYDDLKDMGQLPNEYLGPQGLENFIRLEGERIIQSMRQREGAGIASLRA